MKQPKPKPSKPLGRLGVTIHSAVRYFPAGVCHPLRDGFHWFATEDYETFKRVTSNDPAAIDAQQFYGPFDTREKATKAAEVGICGNAEIEHGGWWDPAWNKKQ